MFDLAEELDSIRGVFSEHRIEFALCSGMAMAIHGFIRATVDLDLLVKAEDIDKIQSSVASLGYITVGNRTSRIDTPSGDTLILDLRIVTGETPNVWSDRRRILWRDEPLSVVSREGLIKLKQLRGSLQDLADVARLPGEIEMSPKAIELRMKRLSQVRNLCLSLAKAGAAARQKGQLAAVIPSTSTAASDRSPDETRPENA